MVNDLSEQEVSRAERVHDEGIWRARGAVQAGRSYDTQTERWRWGTKNRPPRSKNGTPWSKNVPPAASRRRRPVEDRTQCCLCWRGDMSGKVIWVSSAYWRK